MNRDDLDPPAIVHQAKEVSALIARGKMLVGNMATRSLRDVEDAVELGSVCIDLKDSCPHGSYLSSLQEIGISSQDASAFSSYARLPPEIRATCKSIRDLDRCAHGEDPNDDKVRAPGLSTKTETYFAHILCRPCRVGGAKPNCKDCKRIRAEMANQNKEEPEPDCAPPGAGDAWEPGTPAPEPAFFKGDKEPFDWSAWKEAYSALEAQVDVLAEVTTAAEHLRRKLAEWAKEFKAVTKKVYSK